MRKKRPFGFAFEGLGALGMILGGAFRLYGGLASGWMWIATGAAILCVLLIVKHDAA